MYTHHLGNCFAKQVVKYIREVVKYIRDMIDQLLGNEIMIFLEMRGLNLFYVVNLKDEVKEVILHRVII